MAIPDADSPSTSSPLVENSESNPQPFYVLHKGFEALPKTSRKIDLSHKQSPGSVARKVEEEDDFYSDDGLGYLRIEAFHSLWSNIETTIKGVLMEINLTIFNEVNAWAHESFNAVCLHRDMGFAESTQNIEFVDDQLTFEELGNHLKSCGCHVANMSSLDLSAKNGIGGCLTRLLRHFLMVALDICPSWHHGTLDKREYKPLVIIIEDTERCCGAILSDFILLLSEWVVKVPVILVMGIATTLDALRSLLSSNALLQLCTSKFLLGSPSERMNAIVEAVLLRPSTWFRVGHKVAYFLRDYFLKHDGTLTSFVRALKITCMQHFSTVSLSFLMKHLVAEDDLKLWLEDSALMKDVVLENASPFFSCRRVGGVTTEKLADGLSELNSLHKRWATVIMCLYDAGRSVNIQLLDLHCESLDPDSHRSSTVPGRYLKRGSIFQAVQKIARQSVWLTAKNVSLGIKVVMIYILLLEQNRHFKDLPPTALCELVRSWETRTNDIYEICKKVKELQYMMKSLGNKSSGCDLTDISSRNSLRRHSSPKNPDELNANAVALIQWMVRRYWEILEKRFKLIFWSSTSIFTVAVAGTGVADCYHHSMTLQFCGLAGGGLMGQADRLSSVILDGVYGVEGGRWLWYTLAQEHGDIINVHDWYQSFKALMVNPSVKARSKSKRPSTPKKRKLTNHPQSDSESVIQYPFKFQFTLCITL
ncbi:hypothetical protein KSS87_023170 [Heliosperma pusillum]|nr:hypothetical protein KSS87_023170 [Heliosperma pusillum]